MPQILRKKILARELDQAFSNTQREVVWTATMQNGSLLKADNTEAAAVDIADVAFVINDYQYGDNGMAEPAVGDTVQVNCVTFAAKVYASSATFSDRVATVADNAALTALTAKAVELV